MRRPDRLRTVDRSSSYAAGVLLLAAAVWAYIPLAGAATEKQKGACAVLVLVALLVAGSAHLLGVSVPVTFMIRAPSAVAAYAMTAAIDQDARRLVYLALVVLAVSIAAVVVRVLEDVKTRPVSHL